MHERLGWYGVVALALALGPLGCATKGGNEGDDTASEGNTAATGDGADTSGTAGTGGTAAATGSTAAETSATTSAPVDCDGAPDYTATAEVLDEGLGPTGAPVTIMNCSDSTAYVYQDCCYGATVELERKDTADGPWRTSTPSFACDCSGPLESLAIEPSASIVVETNPSMYDSEPLCEDPYSAIYRWTFLIGPDPEPDPTCTDCWESVPTNEFSWYCEG